MHYAQMPAFMLRDRRRCLIAMLHCRLQRKTIDPKAVKSYQVPA